MHIYKHTYIHTHIHTHTYIHTYTYTHTYIHTRTCIHTHTYTHTYIYAHAYIHIRIHIHTSTHTHIELLTPFRSGNTRPGTAHTTVQCSVVQCSAGSLEGVGSEKMRELFDIQRHLLSSPFSHLIAFFFNPRLSMLWVLCDG